MFQPRAGFTDNLLEYGFGPGTDIEGQSRRGPVIWRGAKTRGRDSIVLVRNPGATATDFVSPDNKTT